jgi:hypothetical protein
VARLSVDDFIREVQVSALCRPECWQRLDLDEMAALYATVNSPPSPKDYGAYSNRGAVNDRLTRG